MKKLIALVLTLCVMAGGVTAIAADNKAQTLKDRTIKVMEAIKKVRQGYVDAAAKIEKDYQTKVKEAKDITDQNKNVLIAVYDSSDDRLQEELAKQDDTYAESIKQLNKLKADALQPINRQINSMNTLVKGLEQMAASIDKFLKAGIDISGYEKVLAQLEKFYIK